MESLSTPSHSARVLWTAYWIVALIICIVSLVVSVDKLKTGRENHLWSLIYLQVVIVTNQFINFVADINWHTPVLGDALRVGGMITTSLLIVTIPGFVNSQPATCLNRKIGTVFSVLGYAMAAHYLVSASVFFLFRYNGSIPYFGGYRYVPAYTVFILEAFAVFYCVAAIFTARIRTAEERIRITIMRRGAIVIIALFPLSFVIDLVRYFFPPLWNVLKEERLLFAPLNYAVVSLFFVSYARKGFAAIDADLPGSFSSLSPRESDVAHLLCKGMSYRSIAGTLHISLSTVQSHVKNIYRKVGVNTKEELILKEKGAP